MWLLELILVNFRQYANSTVRFGSGMTAIQGANGTGKSTLLEAVGFALFGEQRSSKDSIRFAWADSKKFSVTLRFRFADRTYEVMRSNDSAYLKNITDGVERAPIAVSLGEVTKAVETVLGLTHEQWINSFCCEQKGLTFLNFKSNADRQREISRMLGFDKLQIAQDAAIERRKAAQAKIEALSLVLGDLDAMKAELRVAELSLLETYDEIKRNATKRSEVEARKPAVDARATAAKTYGELSNQIEALAARHGALKSAHITAEAEVAQATADVWKRTQLAPRSAQFLALEAELKVIATAKAAVQKRTGFEDSIKQLSDQVNALQNAKPKAEGPTVAEIRAKIDEVTQSSVVSSGLLDEEKARWTAKKNAATVELSVAESEHRAAVKARVSAEEKIEEKICPECGQPFGESFVSNLDSLKEAEAIALKRVQSARQAAEIPEPESIKALQAQVSELARVIEDLEVALVKAGDVANTIQTTDSKIARSEEQIKFITEQLAELPKVYDQAREAEIEKDLPARRADHTEFLALAGAQARLERAEVALANSVTELDTAKTSNTTLRAKRDELGFKPKDGKESEASEAAEAAIAAQVALSIELATLTTEGNGLTRRKDAAEATLAAAQRRIDEYKQREGELKAAEIEKSLFETLANEMKTLRLQMNASIRPELASRASEYLSLLTNGRYPLLELDDKFQPSIIDEGTTKSVISGGEEDVVALSLRLALAKLILEQKGLPSSLLVLDEIFGSLDADRRQAVLDLLVALKGIFEQIVLISHIEGSQEVADQCIYLSRDPETKATVVSDGPGEFDIEEAA